MGREGRLAKASAEEGRKSEENTLTASAMACRLHSYEASSLFAT